MYHRPTRRERLRYVLVVVNQAVCYFLGELAILLVCLLDDFSNWASDHLTRVTRRAKQRIRQRVARMICRRYGHQFTEWTNGGTWQTRHCQRKHCCVVEMQAGPDFNAALRRFDKNMRQTAQEFQRFADTLTSSSRSVQSLARQLH